MKMDGKRFQRNKEIAKKLAKLMSENPDLRVVTRIDSEGISDDYAWWVGTLLNAKLQFIAYSEANERYIVKTDKANEDCYCYYGWEAEYWDKSKQEEKAKEIPWEQVISVWVSVI